MRRKEAGGRARKTGTKSSMEGFVAYLRMLVFNLRVKGYH